MARRGAPAAARQQAEPVVQPLEDLLRRERPHPPGGELQGERNPVEAPAQLPYGLPGRPGEREAGPEGLRAGGEQLQRVLVAHRRERVEHLAVHPQREAARGQHPQARRPAQQRLDQVGAGSDVLLVPVQDQQHLTVGEMVEQDLPGRPEGVVGQPQRVDHRVLQQVGVAQAGELGDPHTMAVPFLHE